MPEAEDTYESRRGEIAARRKRRREDDRRQRRVHLRRRLVVLLVVAGLIALPIAVLGHGEDPGPPIAQPGQQEDPSRTAAPPEPAAPSLVAPSPVKLVKNFRGPVPILMYHVITEAPAGAALPGLFVPPDEFEQAVRWLERRGFTAVTLRQVFDAWQSGAKIPSKPVVISFDDGTRDHHDTAAPILAEFGWPGVLNLKMESVRQKELSVEQVDDLVAQGWELASHTLTHPDLTTLDPIALKREVNGSRKTLERRFGVPVDFFCYPAGAYDAAVIAAVEAAGYEGATTTNPGLASRRDPFELSRLRIEPGDGAAGLRTKLENAGVDT